MTEREAIVILSSMKLVGIRLGKTQMRESVLLGIKALDKQIAKSYGCAICADTSNSRYYDNQKYKYCPDCVQMREIDLSEEE